MSGILRERKVWRRPRPKGNPRLGRLSAEEEANVRAALRFLRARHGGWAAVAELLGVAHVTVRTVGTKGRPTAAMALKVATVAGVPAEDVLCGRFPPSGACPYCGR